MPLSKQLWKEIRGTIPSLRAFATSLTGNLDRSDDLVQETLTLALERIDTYRPGTNVAAWLFTILRNKFRSEYRQRKREVADVDDLYAGAMYVPPAQQSTLELRDMGQAIAKLKPLRRNAIMLVGVSGFTFKEAAHIEGCEVVAMKQRVYQARQKLEAMVGRP